MKKIIVHLGVHKTATTSLQTFFSRARDQLATHGVAFFPLSEMRRSITPLIHSNKPRELKSLKYLIESIDHKTILLSDENILGDPSEVLHNSLYQFAFMRIKALCNIFCKHDLEFYLVLRDPVSFIVSMHSEYIRHWPYLEFEDYTRAIDLNSFSFAKVFAWIDALPADVRFNVMDFGGHNKLGPLGIAHSILRSASICPSLINDSLMPRNKSRSSFHQEEIDLFRYISSTSGPHMVKHYINAAEGNQGRFGSTKFVPIPSPVRIRMREQYKEDLRRLVRDDA